MAATGLIQGINPYEGGNVPLDFSSKPTQIAIENIQRQQAQADATQKYFRDYEKSLNPAGLSAEDVKEFNKQLDEVRKYGMKNMQNINNPQNDGYDAYSTHERGLKNLQSFVDQAKQKTANLKATNDFIEQIKRSGKHFGPPFMDMYKAATLPVNDPNYKPFNPALIDVYDQFDLPKEAKDVFSKVDLDKSPGWTSNPLNKNERAPTETTTFNPANAPKLYNESASIINKNPYGVKDLLASLTPADKANLARTYQTELEPHIYGAKDNEGKPYSGKVDAAGKPIPYVSKGEPTDTELLTAMLYRNAPRNTQITGEYRPTSQAKQQQDINTATSIHAINKAYDEANGLGAQTKPHAFDLWGGGGIPIVLAPDKNKNIYKITNGFVTDQNNNPASISNAKIEGNKIPRDWYEIMNKDSKTPLYQGNKYVVSSKDGWIDKVIPLDPNDNPKAAITRDFVTDKQRKFEGKGVKIEDNAKQNTYKFNGKSYTEQDVVDAAKQWNMTVDQYIKKYNIQKQ